MRLFSYLVNDIGEVRNVKHILLLYGKKSKIGITKVCKTVYKLSPRPKDHLLSMQLGRSSLYPPDQSTLRVERTSSSLYARSSDIPLQWCLGQNFLTKSLVVEPL